MGGEERLGGDGQSLAWPGEVEREEDRGPGCSAVASLSHLLFSFVVFWDVSFRTRQGRVGREGAVPIPPSPSRVHPAPSAVGRRT